MLQKRIVDLFKPMQEAKIWEYFKGRRYQLFVKIYTMWRGGCTRLVLYFKLDN